MAASSGRELPLRGEGRRAHWPCRTEAGRPGLIGNDRRLIFPTRPPRGGIHQADAGMSTHRVLFDQVFPALTRLLPPVTIQQRRETPGRLLRVPDAPPDERPFP